MRIFKQIYRAIFPVNLVKKYIRNNSIQVGKNCNITKLTVSLPAAHAGTPYITIGEGCILECHIVVYNPDAKVVIGDRVYIGPQTTLFCNEKIELENDILISWNCTLIDSNAHPLKWEHRKYDVVNWRKGQKDWTFVDNKPIVIKGKSWIGFNSIIMKGVTIAEGCVVAAGSVVTKNADPFTIVGGNPATFIKNTE